MTMPCDLHITRDRRVFINGTEVTRIVNFDLEVTNQLGPIHTLGGGATAQYVSSGGETRCRLELVATSVTYGDPPIDNNNVNITLDKDGAEFARLDYTEMIERMKAREAWKQRKP
jgi:hypothetical protein